MRLDIGLLPRALHGRAPRTLLSGKSWRRISERVREAGKCAVCGSSRNLHAHEEYEIDGRIARLADIVCVCKACHDVIHIGRMYAAGQEERAISRFMTLNGISRARAEEEIGRAFAEWAAHPEEMLLDWSLMSERYGDLMGEDERLRSLLSKTQR